MHDSSNPRDDVADAGFFCDVSNDAICDACRYPTGGIARKRIRSRVPIASHDVFLRIGRD